MLAIVQHLMAIGQASASPLQQSVGIVSIVMPGFLSLPKKPFSRLNISPFQLTGGGRRLGSCYTNQGGINGQNYQFGGQSGYGPFFGGPGIGVAVGVCCSSKCCSILRIDCSPTNLAFFTHLNIHTQQFKCLAEKLYVIMGHTFATPALLPLSRTHELVRSLWPGRSQTSAKLDWIS